MITQIRGILRSVAEESCVLGVEPAFELEVLIPEYARLAILKHGVRRIVAVERRIGAWARRFERKRGTADDRRAGALRQRARCRAVVAVGVGAHDCA